MAEKIAVVLFMEHQRPADRGRMAHALHLARDLKRAGVDLKVVFAGKSVEWLPQLTNPNRAEQHPFVNNYGNVFDEIRPHVEACNFCTIRFDTAEAIREAEIPISGEGRDHMELGRYVLDGYRVITI